MSMGLNAVVEWPLTVPLIAVQTSTSVFYLRLQVNTSKDLGAAWSMLNHSLTHMQTHTADIVTRHMLIG